MISNRVQNGALKFFQDSTDIPGYTTTQRQEAERPYFYFELPRGQSEKIASNLYRHSITLHGVFFASDEEQMKKVLPSIELRLMERDFSIQCCDEEFMLTNEVYEDIQFNYRKSEELIATFTLRGECISSFFVS
ncbi:hypothetical protein [Bacillus sp. CGMCC 1.16541]|uniref:hypothetical protein n=1 Tax=Bacillus sp. CGMCC 1.16541 TaxID=2185143 RepID=UPI000D734448|nr:hypothetical protein [Bacillus sp. CGMCC 1.16541]